MSRSDGLVRTPDGDLVAEVPSTPWDGATAARAPQEVPSHECRDGWLGNESSPAPCPVCRPDTVRRLQQQREKCRICRTRLHTALLEEGYRSHPECDPYETPRSV